MLLIFISIIVRYFYLDMVIFLLMLELLDKNATPEFMIHVYQVRPRKYLHLFPHVRGGYDQHLSRNRRRFQKTRVSYPKPTEFG